MKRGRVVIWMLMGVLLATGAWAQGEPIKIGAMFAVTGPAAWLGEQEKNTALMIADEVNAKGGIDRRPIEVIIEDTEGDDTKGVLAAKERIDLIIIGTVCRRGLAGLIIGNTAEDVLQHVNCSVLALKPEGFVSPIKLEDA